MNDNEICPTKWTSESKEDYLAGIESSVSVYDPQYGDLDVSDIERLLSDRHSWEKMYKVKSGFFVSEAEVVGVKCIKCGKVVSL